MDREKLVEAMAGAILVAGLKLPEDVAAALVARAKESPDHGSWPLVMTNARAALAVAEPVVRADERLACLNVAHRWTRDGHSATAHGIILGIEERTGGTP